jgi:hypothetical protein
MVKYHLINVAPCAFSRQRIPELPPLALDAISAGPEAVLHLNAWNVDCDQPLALCLSYALAYSCRILKLLSVLLCNVDWYVSYLMR